LLNRVLRRPLFVNLCRRQAPMRKSDIQKERKCAYRFSECQATCITRNDRGRECADPSILVNAVQTFRQYICLLSPTAGGLGPPDPPYGCFKCRPTCHSQTMQPGALFGLRPHEMGGGAPRRVGEYRWVVEKCNLRRFCIVILEARGASAPRTSR
jgi:hypothetical protein